MEKLTLRNVTIAKTAEEAQKREESSKMLLRRLREVREREVDEERARRDSVRRRLLRIG
jgi:hypothetical protein